MNRMKNHLTSILPLLLLSSLNLQSATPDDWRKNR